MHFYMLHALLATMINSYYMQMNRVLIAVLVGVLCGILRVEGLIAGLSAFLIGNVVGSGIMLGSLRGKPAGEYFQSGAFEIFHSNLFSGLLPFILVWTVVYDVIHIF
jgi:hypothetical protein